MALSVHDDGFRHFFREHADFVWRALGVFGVPDADRPDCAQKVFLVAHRKRDQVPEGGDARRWLYGIARRVAADQRKRAYVKRERPLVAARELSHSAPSPEARALSSERVALLREVVAALDPEKRDVLVLFEVEGLPMKEVAMTLSCPLKTAYGRLYAARREVAARFRERLGEEVDHGA